MRGEIVLDVREKYRVERQPVEGAVHLPLGALLAAPERVPRGSSLLVVSDRAQDAEFAARYLSERGFHVRAREI
jgi:rhodanese-related sulfurtransferase